MIFRTISALALLLSALAAHADVLKLENGDIITGDIVSFKDELCVFSTKYGSSLRVTSSEIKGIQLNGNFVITLVNGDRFSGAIESADDGKAKVTRDGLSTTFFINEIKDLSVVRSNESSLSGVEKKKESYSPPLNYLSDYTVLLSPGEIDLDFGFKYRTYKTTSALPLEGPYQVSSYSVKKLYLYLNPRIGVTKNLSFSVNLPWTYTRIDDVSSNAYTRDASQGHVGDISGTIQYKLLNETVSHPSLTGTLTVNTPTGRKKYVSDLDSWKQALDNSNGYWSVTPALNFVRVTDPVTIYGGISYEKTFETNKAGERIKYGDVASFTIGTGYALNDVTSFGTQFQYSYSDNMRYEGTEMKGTSSESEALQFYFSYLLSQTLTITPDVIFPLDSSGATFGVGFTRNF